MHLCREARVEGKPDLDHHAGEGLEEEVAKEFADPEVGPPPVDKEEALEEAELGDGVVTALDGLHAFLAADPDPDISRWRGRSHPKGYPWVAKSSRGSNPAPHPLPWNQSITMGRNAHF